MEKTEKKSTTIKLRTTEQQKIDMKKKAFDFGFTSLSAFILWSSLEEDHTETSVKAMTETLEDITKKAEAELGIIREGVRQDREAFLVFLANLSGKFDECQDHIQRIDADLNTFAEEQKAIIRDLKTQKKKEDDTAMVDLLPLVVLFAVIILEIYRFYFR